MRLITLGALALALALVPVKPAKAPKEPKLLPPGSRPAALAARWVEEGYHAEWRLLLRPDGRSAKWRHRKCLDTPNSEKCVPFKYEGTWDADGRRLTLHLPGGMNERFKYTLSGHVLTLTDDKGKKIIFVYQVLDADGQARPKALLGVWSEKARTMALNADGTYSERDEDGEITGTWRADASHLTLLPKDADEDTSYVYKTKSGKLTLQDSLGRSRTLRTVR